MDYCCEEFSELAKQPYVTTRYVQMADRSRIVLINNHKITYCPYCASIQK